MYAHHLPAPRTPNRFPRVGPLAILAVVVIVSACGVIQLPSTDVSTQPPSTPTADGSQPTVALVGTIRDVSESTRAISLAEPVEGIGQVVVTDETGIHQVGETGRRFSDLRPGMRMEVTGLARADGVLVAQNILIIGTEAVGGANGLPPLDVLEQSIVRYFGAVGRHEPGLARQFLSPELSARLSDADLNAPPAVEALGVVFTQSSSITPSRVLYSVGVSARLGTGEGGEWQAGQNNRYLEFVPTPQGWRISQISASPIP